MEFNDILELLKDNAGATAFLKGLQTEQADSKDKMLKLAKSADKYKEEAQFAFEKRDTFLDELEKLKKDNEKLKQSKGGGDGADEALINENQDLKLKVESMSGQILDGERSTVIDGVLDKIEFRTPYVREVIKGEMLKNLVKHAEHGWTYVDSDGKPIRNPENATEYLAPESNTKTKAFQSKLMDLNGLKSKGGNEQLENPGGGGDNKPKTSQERLKAINEKGNP